MDTDNSNTAPASTGSKKSLFSPKRKRLLIGIAIIILIAFGLYFLFQKIQNNKVDSYTDCITTTGSKSVSDAKGTTCTTKDGKQFTESKAKAITWENYYVNPISLSYPPDWTIKSSKAPPIYGSNSTLFRLSGPNDITLKPTPSSLTKETFLLSELTLNPGKKIERDCGCTVLATKGFIFRSSNKKAQLLAVDINGNKQTDLLIVGSESVKVGDTNVKKFFDFNDKYQLAFQSHVADKLVTTSKDQQYQVEDAQAFLNSDSVDKLLGIYASISFK